MPSRPSRRPFSRASQCVLRSAASVCLAAIVLCAHPQNGRSSSEHPDSRLDIYGGYGYLHPVNSGVNGYQFQDIYNPNVTASVTGWFNHYFGVQAEGSYFSDGGLHRGYIPTCYRSGCDQLVYTAEGGPVFRLPLGRFVPFAHILGGGERTNGPAAQSLSWGWGVTGGLGVDYVLPFFNNHLAVRPIQADFQYSQVSYGPLALPAGTTGGLAELDALKLSGGLVLRFGEKGDTQPVMLACSAEPASVHTGDTVTVTASTLNLNPKRHTQYTWTANGGKLTPAGATTAVDTTGLAAGEYTVRGQVSQGAKAHEQASCDAPFTVRPAAPPSLTCTAIPASAPAGTTIDISTTGTSPDNRPLSYSYNATAGQINGAGATAKLTTAGLGETTVTVTCNVVDDRGQSATATTTVTLAKPPLPVVPQTRSLCTIRFDRDPRRPVRVDNESKACLDDIALTMGQDTSAKLEIIGNADKLEKPEAAAQRALNERQYLQQEKGIDASRIVVRVGDTSGRSVRNVLEPAGATFDDSNTMIFDETRIPRSGQAYGTGHGPYAPGRHIHRKRRHVPRPAPVTYNPPGQ